MPVNGELTAYVPPVEVMTAGPQALMPAMQMQQAIERYDLVLEFTKRLMKPGIDYGVIPGVEKPSLKKPGAEKLCSFFGLAPQFQVIKEVEDWTGANHGGEPFFYYWYKCNLFRGNALIAESDGSCNSRESKYRYRWVTEDQLPAGVRKEALVIRGGRISEFTFAVEKAETGGRYGKPATYWQQFQDAIANGMARSVRKQTRDGREFDAWEIDTTQYRVANPDVADQVNSILKMAQKRALIAAVLIACNASEYYTQDLEDLDYIDAEATTAQPVQQRASSAPNGTANGSAPKAGEPLEAIVEKIVDLDSAVSVFAELRQTAAELLGDDGLAQYQATLERFPGKNGPVRDPADFPSRNVARACAARLLQLIRSAASVSA